MNATSCVAVGYYTVGVFTQQTLVERWDGSQWSLVSSPNQGSGVNSGSVLNGVSCASANYCVAVGVYYDSVAAPQTLVESWDGTQWTIISSPNGGYQGAGNYYLDYPPYNYLYGVSCVSVTSCVAVGKWFYAPNNDNGTYVQYVTLVETWNGSQWSLISSPSPSPGSGFNNSLNGVSCVSPTSCVAVGSYDTTSGTQTLVETWDGTGWSVATSPSPGTNNSLVGVSCPTGGSCATVGLQGSSPSKAETLIVSGGSAPSAPTLVSGQAANASASVSWTAPVDNGGGAITAYTVSCASSDDGTPSSATGAASPVVVSGLTNGDTYTCTVTATNAVGTSLPSNPSNAFVPETPPPPPPPPPPTTTTLPSQTVPGVVKAVIALPGDGTATIHWRSPVSNGGSAITGYVVTPYLGFGVQPSVTFSSTATTETLAGLSNGKTYRFKVAALNAIGTGPSLFSNAVTVGTPTAPRSVVASGGKEKATLSWKTPASNNSAIVTGYIVTPYLAGTAQPVRVFTSTATKETITGLTRGKTYTFTVAAKNARGVGPASVASNSVTPT